MKRFELLNKKNLIIILSISFCSELLFNFFLKNNLTVNSYPLWSPVISFFQIYCLIRLIDYSKYPLRLKRFLEKRKWFQDHFFGDLKSPLFISIFRIFFALICLSLVFQILNESYLDFKYYLYLNQLNVIEFLHYFWIFILLLVLLGSRRRAIYVINFFLCYYFFEGNVGDLMLKIAAFWSIFLIPQGPIYLKLKDTKFSSFLGFSKKKRFLTPLWAVFLMGINLSFIVTIAGVFKALDPVWLEGLGFYYAFLQPWIRVPESTFLLNEKWFVYSMNYLGIIFETLALFFFPFKKTRPLSIFLLFCFLILVLYPLRIDPVAPAGLVLLLGILSMQDISFANVKSYKTSSSERKIDTKFLIIALSIFLMQFSIITLQRGIFSLKYPYTSKPFQLNKAGLKTKEINSTIEINQSNNLINLKNSFISIPKRILKFILKYKVVNYGSIFTHQHSLVRSVYFIDAYTENEKLTPFKVYNNDGSIHPEGLRAGFLRPLNIHVVYGQLGVIYHKLTLSKNLSTLNDSDFFLLERLFHFAKVRMNKKNIHSSIIKYHIRIYSINVPDDYAGIYQTISNDNYAEISYDVITKKFKIINIKGKSRDFRKINISSFKSGDIIFNPF